MRLMSLLAGGYILYSSNLSAKGEMFWVDVLMMVLSSALVVLLESSELRDRRRLSWRAMRRANSRSRRPDNLASLRLVSSSTFLSSSEVFVSLEAEEVVMFLLLK